MHIPSHGGGHLDLDIVICNLDEPAHFRSVHPIEDVDRPPQADPMLSVYWIGALAFGGIVVPSQSEAETHSAPDEEEGRMAAIEEI